MDILSLNNISQEFFLPRKLTDIVTNRPARSIRAVQSMNLAIHENEILGIAGESGCGKSTTCMIAAGLLSPTDGDVLHRGQALTAMDEQTKKTFRRSVQIIFQDPYESLNPRFEIGDTVAEGPRAMNLWPEDVIQEKVRSILAAVGLDPDRFMKRYPHELSGGERQRVGIAAALVMEPDIVFADEPLSMLDVSIRADILTLIKTLAAERKFSCVYVSHDLSILGNVADRIMIMYLGQAVEIGSAHDVLTNPKHPYTKALISAVPIPDPTIDRGVPKIIGDLSMPVNAHKGCQFAPRCPYAQDTCWQEFKSLSGVTGLHESACLREDAPDVLNEVVDAN